MRPKRSERRRALGFFIRNSEAARCPEGIAGILEVLHPLFQALQGSWLKKRTPQCELNAWRGEGLRIGAPGGAGDDGATHEAELHAEVGLSDRFMQAQIPETVLEKADIR